MGNTGPGSAGLGHAGPGTIGPGTDLAERARVIGESHDAFIRGSTAPGVPRAEVLESWRRSRRSGLDPDVHRPPTIERGELLERLSTHVLAGAIDRIRRLFTDSVNHPHLLMAIFDADGVLLYRGGPDQLLAIADTMGLIEGTRWDEGSAGTSAASLVMATGTPQLVFSTEHYARALHSIYCSAAPVHDARTGEIAAVVGVAGPAMELQPASTALTTAIAALGEHEIETVHERARADLRVTTAALLAGMSGPGLVVDEDGWVAEGRGFTAPERIAVPVAGTRQFVAGMGMSDAEKLPGGWLLRPAGPSAPVNASLVLRGEPTLTVTGDTDNWRAVLTPRHAQILMLLSEAGESGLTSARLSHRLFGDSGHLVTVRAEMSRLRRAVGSLVTSRPYRLAAGVELTVIADPSTPGTPDASTDETLTPAAAADRGPLDTPHGEMPPIHV